MAVCMSRSPKTGTRCQLERGHLLACHADLGNHSGVLWDGKWDNHGEPPTERRYGPPIDSSSPLSSSKGTGKQWLRNDLAGPQMEGNSDMDHEERLGRILVSNYLIREALSLPDTTTIHHIRMSGWRPDTVELLISDPSFEVVPEAAQVPLYRFYAARIEGHFDVEL